MKTTFGMLMVVLAGSGVMSLTAGCEDAAARTRDSVQQTIARATDEFERATSAGVDPADPATRAQILGIITSLNGLTGGDPGQLAAAALLSANAHQQLGAMDLLKAEQLESDHRLERLVVHRVVDLVGELEAVADVQAGFDPTQEQAELDRHRSAANQSLADLGKRMAELDEPIASLSSLNDADSQKVNQLKKEANVLYGQATSLGHLEGFDAYEQAVDRRRDAEKLERQISDRQGELEFNYEADRAMAQRRADMNRTLIADIDRAGNELKEFGKMSASEAQATRTAINTFGAEVDKRLNRLESEINGDLAAAYEQAAEQFQKAASDAGNAAGKSAPAATSAARLTAASAQQSLAGTHWTRARGLSNHAAMLARLVGSGRSFGNPQALESKLKAAQTAYDSAVELAKAAITAAREALDQITSQSDAADVNAIKSNLSMLQASLEGQKVDWSALTASSAAPIGRSASSSAAGNTPEALLELIKKLDQSKSSEMRRYFDFVHFKDPAARSLSKNLVAFAESRAAMKAAIESKFGKSSSEPDMPNLPDGFPTNFLNNAAITAKTADRATVSYSFPGLPGKQTFDLVKISDRWFIDGDSMPMPAHANAGEMAQNIGKMTEAAKSITERVKAGEFATREDAMAAYVQAMMQSSGIKMPDPGKYAPPGASDK